MAKDKFAGRSLSDPPEYGFPVTKSDSAELAAVSRALYVGGAGDLRVRTAGGNDLLFKAVPAGTLLPIRADMVFSTNTTATDIVALY
ncbi:MAG: hypothetical protein BWX64_02076 [Acidobacteria bacterium ADurb.Bin051]|nr:MAG: hypothetical protein BWX64_02076 [Acidobacteria bacterium ADurb.Bin051]